MVSFEENLITPFQDGSETLLVVSGYASATMAHRHFQGIKQAEPRRSSEFRLELLVGMCPEDGIARSTHEGFSGLSTGPYKEQFDCRYVVKGPPVHTKLYIWMSEEVPYKAFTGSANYSQRAFSPERREMLVDCAPKAAKRYFDHIRSDTLPCTDPLVSDLINIYDGPDISGWQTDAAGFNGDVSEAPAAEPVQVSLLDRSGSLPARSGLNWGQRPEQNREPNQAYIRVPLSIARTDFFPEIGRYFTLLTDDGEALVCVRAQQGGKAIQTPQDNSILGRYFRKRLGIPSGDPVTAGHLNTYGRNQIEFFPIDSETYWMDFSN